MNNEKLDNDIKNLKIKSLFSMYLTNVKYHYILSFSLLVNNFKEFIIYFVSFIISLVLLPIGFLINLFSLIIVYFNKLHRIRTEDKQKRNGIDYSYHLVASRENEDDKYYDGFYIYHRLRLIERKKELEDKQ